MGSIIEFILRIHLAALALIATTVKTVFHKWSGVDQASTIACIVMFVISLLTWNSWLLICWIGAAVCLSIASAQGWQWDLLAELQSIRQQGLAQSVKESFRVDVV